MDSSALSQSDRRKHLALVALGGAAQFLGFAGFGLWPLVFISYIPMMFVLEREGAASKKRIAALGFAHGFVTYTGGYHWLVDMLVNFSGYPESVAWVFASVFFAYMGLQHICIYATYVWARRRNAPPFFALLAPALFFEWIYPYLFPSFVGTGLHVVPHLIQTADLGGPILVSALPVVFAGAVFEWYRYKKGLRAFPRSILIGVTLFVLFVPAYGAYRIAEVDGRDVERISVGTVQANMGLLDKRVDPLEGHRRHLDQSIALQNENPALGLIVWPETAFTRFIPESLKNVKNAVLGDISTPVLFGALRAEQREREHHFNTAFIADAAGNLLGSYDKTYLLMFGEYLPLGEMFPSIYELSPNSGRFTPGNHTRPLVLPRAGAEDLRMSILICYEDVLPGFTRDAVASASPNLLVNITNDAWFGNTQEPWIHLALAKFRAVEHHRSLVRSTNSGVSAFIDPVGRELGILGVEVQDQMARELPLLSTPTLYGRTGDWPAWFAGMYLLWLLVRARLAQRRKV